MTLRHIIRDILRPLCILIENTLEKTPAAQKLRRLQHRLFGLTVTEWRMLNIYLSCRETMDTGVQRQGWISAEITRLEEKLSGLEFNESDPEIVELAIEWWEMCEEGIENMDFCDQTLGLLREAQRGLAHTPVYRGLYDTRGKKGMGHWSSWLRARCAKAGGCCGRPCQCCRRERDHLFKMWRGHCTDACRCCMEHAGVDVSAGSLDCTPGLAFDIGPGKEHKEGRMLVKSLVWGG
ncbi:hypothetical protein ASPVEDRAFT_28448 [Aspergillus versicolor CBS 583.65]|uniref:Uncharacterized protein n=1 Tax=Aspergillus versicolor CBS 583.65 TaxID=1036611 RepID=A0A1L9PJZ3_ASPVE|nr:uncharacterized protein ASPVEDRAFT_28448 [Aspergillus versicolor CBS 583.65]OJJ01811.1 hypothetical protein ASPVEDRAFT_28448 [Aspergillus versicolor CBS 583.65]